MYFLSTLSFFILLPLSFAQTPCSNERVPSYAANVASGYRVGLVATGLSRPRSLQFDTDGHLLVVDAAQSGEPAIIALTLTNDSGACVREQSRKYVVEGENVW